MLSIPSSTARPCIRISCHLVVRWLKDSLPMPCHAMLSSVDGHHDTPARRSASGLPPAGQLTSPAVNTQEMMSLLSLGSLQLLAQPGRRHAAPVGRRSQEAHLAPLTWIRYLCLSLMSSPFMSSRRRLCRLCLSSSCRCLSPLVFLYKHSPWRFFTSNKEKKSNIASCGGPL